MLLIARAARLGIVSFAAIALAACAGQKEPAQKLVADIDATVMAASAEASKYVPEQLTDVQTKLDALKASFAKQDYATIVTNAPAVLAAAQGLAIAAAEKKDAVLKALTNQWAALAASVPANVIAVQNRIEFLSKKTSKKLAAGIDLNAAKTGIGDAQSLWSKAQAAFAAGNLSEAVTTAKEVKTRVATAAAALKLDLATPAASS
jgi:hypothetical protein